MTTDRKLEDDFVAEAKLIVKESIVMLEGLEGNFDQVSSLADFGNKIDRIMGGARSLAVVDDGGEALGLIGDYAELCKSVAYKSASITDNRELFDVCVALLLDAVETLDEILDSIEESQDELKKRFSEAFVERLKWVSQQFAQNVANKVGDVSSDKLNQNEIDDILAKLGF